MKIINNPVMGIGLLLCVGLAVWGLSLLPTAEGQHQGQFMVSSDEQNDDVFISRRTRPQVLPLVTTDENDEIFVSPSQSIRTTRTQTVSPPSSVRIAAVPKAAAPPTQDPFATPDTPQRRLADRSSPALSVSVSGSALAVRQKPLSAVEKRDELLHRIVQLRLQRGEFEKIPPAVSQMQKPETAIETILDFVEQSDDENIGQLLDMITVLTVQMGQPPHHHAIIHPNFPM